MAGTAFILPIVEGQGEEEAIRILLNRVWYELLAADSRLEILRPWRMPRTRMPAPEHMQRVVLTCALKLRQKMADSDRSLLLILADADDDLPCELGPRISLIARNAREDVESVCVVANRMYETWFAASAESLVDRGFLRIDGGIPDDPEEQRLGKSWLKKHFVGSYKETIDQSKLTHAMDLELCRRRSPSFDKLCRELSRLLG